MKKAKGKNVNKKPITIKVHDLLPPSLVEKDKKRQADDLLADIRNLSESITALENSHNAQIKCLTALCVAQITPLKEDLATQEKAIIALMKKERKTLFDGTDVVQLENGALIHEVGDHVHIPKGALAKCKELEFLDVIKTVESLNRDAIEKWKDEKLLLIGAERKPTETFSYDLKKETHAE